METQEITLSFPKDIVEKVGLTAARRHISVSGLLARALKELVEQEDAYARARQCHLQLLEAGFHLGTGGQIQTNREEIHERD